jgi:hypothetical protein
MQRRLAKPGRNQTDVADNQDPCVRDAVTPMADR